MGNVSVCQFDITQYFLPEADAGQDRTITIGDTTQLGGSPTGFGTNGPYQYIWNPSATLDANNVSNPSAFPTATTTYLVFAIDSVSGCSGTNTVTVTVVNTTSGNKSQEEVGGKLNLFPNPASDKVYITFKASKEQAASFILENMLGQQFQHINLQLQKGDNEIHFDVSGLDPGVYNIRIQNGKEDWSLRFVKL